jgi:hypothetical protein
MLNSQSLSEQQSFNTVISPEVSSLANNFWVIVTDDKVMRSVDSLGLLLATLAVCLWCLQTYKTFKKQGLRPKVTEIVLPLLLIGLLFNNGRYLKELTFATKNIMNSTKAPLNKVVDKGSQSLIVPMTCAEQNHKSAARSGIPVDNCNLSTSDAMRNAHIQESTIRLYNYYSIE